MAISLKTAGTWAEYIADGTVAIPGSPAAGDRMFLFASWKNWAITAAVSGWTAIGSEFADGAVDKGNGTGSMKVMAWYRDWQSGDTNPTLAFTTMGANDIAGAVIQLWQKASMEVWSTPLTVTGAMTNWTTSSQVFSASATVAVPNGAVVMGLVGIRDNSATMTRGATTGIDDSAAAITWAANYVESPVTHFDTTTGFDMSADLGHRLVTTGATATLRMEGTISASETGAGKWVVQGVTVATNVPAENAAWTGTANQPSVGVSPAAGLAAGTGTANDATVAFARDVDAGLASGTGTANQPAAGVDGPAGNAAGSGAALQPGAGVSPAAGLASGSGVANDATVSIGGGGPAWHAWSTTFSNPVSAFTNADAGLAAGSGTAFNAAVALDANAAAALAIATAYDPSIGVAVGAGLAEGSGTAYNATVQITQGAVNAYAGLAEGFGTAWDATVETTGRGGHPGRGIVRRRSVVPQPVLVPGELVIRIPAPQFAMTGSVNDDEGVLELLFLDL